MKFVSIQNPGININCGANITPQVEVKNNGTNSISSVTVNYTIDATPYNFVWNGTLAPSATTIIDLPAATLSRGVHSLNVTTTITNDAYSDNNSGLTQFYVNDAGTIGQVNPFTNTADALISYTEGSSTPLWVRGTRGIGPMGTGANTVYTTNLTGTYPDMTKAYLISQCYNLNNVVNPMISFDMKFDIELNWDVVYVEYSTNMGASWSVLGTAGPTWYNSSRTSATSGNDCYNCPGAQWTGLDTTVKTYTYPLNTFNTESNIIFRIVFHSDESANQLGVNIDNFVIVLLIFGASRNIFNLSINAQSLEVQKLYPKSIITRFHAVWSIAVFSGAGLGYVMVTQHIAPSHHLLGVSVFMLALTACFYPLSIHNEPVPVKKKFFAMPEKNLIKFAVICFVSIML